MAGLHGYNNHLHDNQTVEIGTTCFPLSLLFYVYPLLSFLCNMLFFFFFLQKRCMNDIMRDCGTTHTHGIPFWYRPCPHMQPPAPFPTICDIENEHQLREKKKIKDTYRNPKTWKCTPNKHTSSPTVQASIPQTRVIA